MDPLYLRKLLINKQLKQETILTNKSEKSEIVNTNASTETNVTKQAENLVQEIRQEMLLPRRDLKMNYLASMERSGYVKKIMNLPKTLPELLMQLQNEDSIADEMTEHYYQQNKQKQENLKSDIREGIIRNADESFEETLKGVNKGINEKLPKPDVPQPKSNVELPKPDVPQQKPNVVQPTPPRHSELDSESFQPSQTELNQPSKPELSKPNQEVKSDVAQQKPNVEPPKADVPQQKPSVELPKPDVLQPKPNVVQSVPPRHSELDSESFQLPQTELNQSPKPELPKPNQELKVDTPQQKPSMAQPTLLRHSELDSESFQPPKTELNQPPKPELPKPNQEVKADVPQPKPSVEPLKSNVAQPIRPRHSELDSESFQPSKTELNQPPKPELPKPNQEVKSDVAQQKPNVEPPKSDVPQPKPNVELPKSNVAQPIPPRPSEGVNQDVVKEPLQQSNQPPKTELNQPPKQNIIAVNQQFEQKPMYGADDMLRQYMNNELWQPNVNHGTKENNIKPDMLHKPQQPLPPQTVERPIPPQQPLPPQTAERPTPPQQPLPPQTVERPTPPQQPLPPQTVERPTPSQQPLPPQTAERPNPPQRPVIPNVQHNPEPPIKSEVIGFKPDIGLQEYMRYEMLRPQPQSIDKPLPVHDMHKLHHRHVPPPPPENKINQETMAAMNIMQNVQQPTEPTITQMRQRLSGDAVELFFTGLINLNDLSDTIKNNSKGAKAKLVLAMANASKQGIDNSQINDTLNMISASMAATENTTPSKILKNIIELYLPWYPLQQGVGFDLSIETKPGEQDFLSVLKVWIQTRNYGNVNAILTLMNSNSVDMNIQCSEKFPKNDLLQRLNDETKNRTMQSNISVEEFEQTEGFIEPQQQAKVSLSSTYEMNPFLLLLAHSFIKNTIVIDSNITLI